MAIGYPPSGLKALPNHRFRALLQFGELQEYGVHEMQRLELDPGIGSVELNELPEGLVISLEGTGWLMLGGAFSKNSTFVQWFPPYSAAASEYRIWQARIHCKVEPGPARLAAFPDSGPVGLEYGRDLGAVLRQSDFCLRRQRMVHDPNPNSRRLARSLGDGLKRRFCDGCCGEYGSLGRR